MPWTTLTLQVTTPLFNGGADPSGEAGLRAPGEAGVRVASIRGAMRFWFRALAGAYTGLDLALLAALERRVFGGIAAQRDGGADAVQSPLILRLPEPPHLSSDMQPEFLRGPQWRGIAYLLGLGLMEMKDKPARPHLLRPCVLPDPEHTFALKVRFQHDRRGTAETQHAIEALAFASLWLATIYGGLGARTRRGFGGVRIVGGDGDLPAPWDQARIHTPAPRFFVKSTSVWPPEAVVGQLQPQLQSYLRELAKGEGKELSAPDAWTEPPPFPVLSQRFAPAALTPDSRQSWEEVLGRAGDQLRYFRANRQQRGKDGNTTRNTAEWDDVIDVNGEYADFPLGALGLPVVFHDKVKNYSLTVNAVDYSSASESVQLRRASPLWLRPVGAGTSWRLLSYAFQGRFLPDGEDVRVRLLPDSRARDDRREEDDLLVEDQHVTQLTNQWIDTMRVGGDFMEVDRV
jgi:CRISPR-associated protein Cmr1